MNSTLPRPAARPRRSAWPSRPRATSAIGIVTAATTALVLLILLAAAAIAPAATWSGTGPNDFWSTADNWGGAAPASPEPLVFVGATRPNPENDFPVGTPFNGISFSPGAAPFTVGGNGVVLGGDVINHSASTQTIALPVTIGALSPTATLGTKRIEAAGGPLVFAGPVDRQRGSAVIFEPGGNGIQTPLANGPAGILGAWATIGTDWAAADGASAMVPYAGYSDFSGTAFPAGVDLQSNLRWSGGATLTLPANTAVSTFMYTEAFPSARRVNITGSLRFADGGGIFRTSSNIEDASALEFSGGSVTAGAANTPAEFVVRTNAADESHNLSVNFFTSLNDNGPAGPVTLIKTGPGALRFNNANNYSGGTYLHQGTVRAQANVTTSFGTGPVYVADGAQLYINNSGTAPNDIFLNGVGIVEELYTGGAFRIANAGGAVSGTITLTGDALIGSRGAQTVTGTGARLIGRITGDYELSLNVRTGQGNATTLNMPTLTLESPQNDWAGGTRIGRGRVRLGASEVLPHGPGKGDVILLGEADVPGNISSAPSILNLNGQTETANGLWSEGVHARAIVESTTGGAALLRVGANDASATFAGSIRNGATGGAVSLTKVGAGVQVLSGLNTYTGPTSVEAGTLLVDGSYAGGGQFTVAPGATLGGAGMISTSGIQVAGAISPGRSLGQLGVNGPVAFLANSRLQIEIGGDDSDRLAISGNLDIAPGAMLELLFAAPLTRDEYIVLTYSGNQTGSFSSALLPPGYRLVERPKHLAIEVVPIPEPASLAIGLGALVGWIAVGRALRTANRQ